MPEYKVLLAVLTASVFAVIYLRFIRLVLTDRSDPPFIITWMTWAINLTVGASVQYLGGGEAGWWPIAVDATFCWAIVWASVHKGGKLGLNNEKKAVLYVALAAAGFRFFPMQFGSIDFALIGGWLACVSSFFGALLMARDVLNVKANGVSTEPPMLYVLMGCLATFAAIANSEYNVLTLMYVSQYAVNVWIIAGCLLFTQRNNVSKSPL